MNLALYQPDIPQNAGAAGRLTACLGLALHIIEPSGFVWSDSKLRRAGMDYLLADRPTRHANFESFKAAMPGRVILLTTRATLPYTEVQYLPDDTLLLGRESSGVPDMVHDGVDERVIIPLRKGMRSLNVVNAAAMVVGEALRQTSAFPQIDN